MIHLWMEWHGRITALDDLALFDEVNKIKTDSVILPASPTDIPILSDADVAEADDLWGLPDLVPASTEDTATVQLPTVPRPARRNLAPEFGSGAVTQARARASTSSFADGPRNDGTLAAALATVTSTENMSDLLAMNASLQSDPQEGVPKNYKELIKLKDPSWQKSLDDELENFLKRDAWEFIPRTKLPDKRKTLHCRWIFKMKTDGSKKSRSVIRGYEQIPGVDFVESFSPLATNTTIKVTIALTMEQMALHEDWVIEMVDVEAAFLNAPVDTDVYIELPEGLREYHLRKYQEVDRFDLREDMIIRLKRAQYGLVQSPQLWMSIFAKILAKLGLVQCKTDPCLFTLHDEDGNLLAIVVVYCDDSIITGFREAVDRLKRGISCAVTISDLGKLVRHLGVDYEFGRDDYGAYIKSSMTEYIEYIVRDFEKD